MNKLPPPMLLCVSAHDPSGGAGLVADAPMAARCGVYPLSILTASTAQNFDGMHACESLSATQVQRQFAAIESLPIQAVKVGVVGAHVGVVAAAIRHLKEKNESLAVVIDPVIAPTMCNESAAFINKADYAYYTKELLSLADIITPNCEELLALTASDSLTAAVVSAVSHGIKNIVMTDAPVCGNQFALRFYSSSDSSPQGGADVFIYKRNDDANIHGSGCRFSTALASGLARGMALPDAIVYAGETMQAILQHRFSTGQSMQAVLESPRA